MNEVAFHLGEPIYWYLTQQQQIETLHETPHLQIEDADISATDRIFHLPEQGLGFADTIKSGTASGSGCSVDRRNKR